VGEHNNRPISALTKSYIDQERADFKVGVIDGDHVPMFRIIFRVIMIQT
jgi:hypothetical protein